MKGSYKPNYTIPGPPVPEAPQQPMYPPGNMPYQQPYPQQYNTYQPVNQPRPKAPPIPAKNKKPIHTAFFSNIPFNYPIESFKQFVSQYGEIVNMYSLIDKKGIAFVTYYDIRNAEKAVEQANDKLLNGRNIRTNYANKSFFPHRDPRATCASIIIRCDKMPTNIQLQDVFNSMKEYGEIQQALPGEQPGQFIIRYYDIRDAQKAYHTTNQRLTIKNESLSMDFLLDDEDNETPPNMMNQPMYNQPPYIPQNPYEQPYMQQPPPNYGMPMPHYGVPPQQIPPQQIPPQPTYGMPSPTTEQGMIPPPQPNYGMPPQYQPPIQGQPSQSSPPQTPLYQVPPQDKAATQRSLEKLKMLIGSTNNENK